MVRRIVMPTLCVSFWLAVIFGFLYLPLMPWFTKERSINIFVWNELVTEDTIVAFERETGIKVNVSYFDFNAELFTKLKATGGKGYDLITPSNFIVEQMVEEGLIKKLDKTRFTFLDRIDPMFMGLSFDPGNEYTVPFYWGTYGVGINKQFFGDEVPRASWDVLFKEGANPACVIMSDGMRVTSLVAAYYLFPGQQEVVTEEQVEQVTTLLKQQKSDIAEAYYTEARAAYLINAAQCSAALLIGNELWRFMKKNPDVVFLSPQEGGFLHIDSIVIPAASTKDDLVYQFINYLYQREPMERRFDEYGFLPPTTTEIKELAQREGINGRLPLPGSADFAKLRIFGPILTNEQINAIWLALKA